VLIAEALDTEINRFIAIKILTTRAERYLAPLLCVAGFLAIAKFAVVANLVIGRVNAGIARFVARIERTSDSVITVGRSTRLATVHRIACLRPVAILSVVAAQIIGRVDARIRRFVARVNRTTHAVTAVRRRAGKASIDQVA
jgi:hypothetical protein